MKTLPWRRLQRAVLLGLVALPLGIPGTEAKAARFHPWQQTPPTGGQTGNSVLIAAPYEGHSGDPIYLSGRGLHPNHQETITMACPSWVDAFRGASPGNMEVLTGPLTNKHGNFSAFRMPALTLHGLTGSGCVIYADQGVNMYGPDIPATYTIVPLGQPLDRCARTICTRVQATVKNPHGDPLTVITLQPGPKRANSLWPGAAAGITVTIPRRHPWRVHRTLDTQGRARLVLHLPRGRLTRLHVGVHLQLGPYRGQSNVTLILDHAGHRR